MNSVLLTGAKCLMVKGEPIAVVQATGFRSMKGQLARTILFMKEPGMGFFHDSHYFIMVMACLSLLGYLISLPALIDSQNTTFEIISAFLELVTVTVPAQLPIALSIGVEFTIKRLKA